MGGDSMNKMVKGSVAGATGIVLLMGGFGTYALWSDSMTGDAGKIASGDLDIESVGAPVWADISVGATTTAWSTSDLMVPGDKVQVTVPLDVTAKGKNLQVKLSVDGFTNDFDNLAVNVSYAGEDETFTGAGPFELNYAPSDLAALTAASAAVVTFDLPTTVSSQDDTNKTLDLSDVTLHLEQVRP